MFTIMMVDDTSNCSLFSGQNYNTRNRKYNNDIGMQYAHETHDISFNNMVFQISFVELVDINYHYLYNGFSKQITKLVHLST